MSFNNVLLYAISKLDSEMALEFQSDEVYDGRQRYGRAIATMRTHLNAAPHAPNLQSHAIPGQPARRQPTGTRRGLAGLPEFEVGLLTIRSGARMVRVTAGDSLAARTVLQAECDAGQCDCPPEMCTDDVETTIRYVKQVALDDVALITADGVALGTLYTDDSLRKKQSHCA